MSVNATAIVLTFNGELWLDKTLSSLDFCSEILVVDSGSTDRTLEIARAHGARILTRAFEGTIPQFRFAFEKVTTPWVVTLDQDEWFDGELKAAAAAALADPGNKSAFWVNRRNFYFDRYLAHSGWYPDSLLRIFRLDSVKLAGRLPHEEFHPTGETGHLKGDIVHHPYRDFHEHVAKINSYAQAGALAAHAAGRRTGTAKAFLAGMYKFFKQYVLKKGFLDGRSGFILAVNAFFYTFQKYLRIMEIEEKSRK